MLERHELEAFLTLAEELHFGRTAERLHVSTARISQTIRKLERRVGVSLFNRTTRRVELSPVGRRLYDDLRPAWAATTAALAPAIEAGKDITRKLRVGFTGAAGGQLLVGIIELFHQRYPECQVEIREAQLGDLMPSLRDGTVDLALATLPVHEPGIVAGPVLVSEAQFLAVPVSHPFARRDTRSVDDLADVTALRLPDTLPQSQRVGHDPEAIPATPPTQLGRSTATFQELLTLVGAGRGVCPSGQTSGAIAPAPTSPTSTFRTRRPCCGACSGAPTTPPPRVRAFNDAAHNLVCTSMTACVGVVVVDGGASRRGATAV